MTDADLVPRLLDVIEHDKPEVDEPATAALCANCPLRPSGT